jgi:hypothetical protein
MLPSCPAFRTDAAASALRNYRSEFGEIRTPYTKRQAATDGRLKIVKLVTSEFPSICTPMEPNYEYGALYRIKDQGNLLLSKAGARQD